MTHHSSHLRIKPLYSSHYSVTSCRANSSHYYPSSHKVSFSKFGILKRDESILQLITP